MSLKDQAAKGMMWSALNNATMQVLNAIFGIVLARMLTQDDYGMIGMLTVFSLVAISLQDSGFVTALTNRVGATHRDYNSVFWFNISASACLYLILYAAAPLIASFYGEPLLTPLSRYYFLGFLVASFNIVPRAVLFRQIKQKELAIMNISALFVSGTVGITMAYHGMAYWGLATQTITFNLMNCIMSWYLSHWRPTFDITMQPVREMFGFSSKMLLTNIFNQVNNNIFSLVLGKFYSKTEVGLYNQANKWNLMGASTITGMVQGVAQPTFVAVGNDPERLCRAFSKMLRLTSFISFPLMFGLSLVAPEFITVLITDKWLPSAHLMRILCISGAFLPIATLYFNLIISQGKSNIYMWNVISQGITILAVILLIHYATHSPLITPHASLFTSNGVTLMVLAYATITILWIAIWHWFLRRLIPYTYRQALRDTLPFLIIAAVSMALAYIATSGITNPFTLLALRIPVAAGAYLILNYICVPNIMRECIGYIFKRNKS